MRARYAVLFVSISVLTAQETWKAASELPALDLSSLTPAQRQTTLQLLRTEGCPCGCNMRIAECRIKDPACSFSRSLAAAAVREIKAGKSAAEVKTALANYTPPPPRLLDDPVNIPTMGAPSRGPADAKITIVEFSDFQCPYCAVAFSKANEVLKRYPKDVRLIFKQFPLDMHSEARLAAMAALAANEQGKFWELHDKMFTNFRHLNRNNILQWAQQSGLDMPRFTTALDSGKYAKTVEKDLSDGTMAGVQGTPTFFINGQRLNAALDTETLQPIIEAARKK